MISYAPMWETMRRKNITTYTLIKDYSFSKGTLDSLKQGRNISTVTLNDICRILDCRVEEVLRYIPDEIYGLPLGYGRPVVLFHDIV